MHLMIAAGLKQPLLAVSEEESDQLADAIIKIGNEYGVKVTGKAAASINLLVTVIIIYGGKILAIKMQASNTPAQSVQTPQVSAVELAAMGVSN